MSAMHKRVQRLLICVACLALLGCRTPLEPPSGERSITEGVTTYEQVVKAFGKPDAEMRGSDGKRLVSYYQTRAKRSFDSAMFGVFAKNQGQVEFRNLDILFSPQKVVERYHYSAAAEQVRSHVSHMEIGNAVTEEKLARLKKGITTRTEAVELLGPPLGEGLNLEGQIVLTWMYGRVGTFGAGDTQVLAIILDKNEKVEDYRIQERAR